MRVMSFGRLTVARAGIAACLLTIGCGDDTSGDGTEDKPAASAVVMGVWVRGPERGDTYLIASEKMPTGKIDLSKALELSDGMLFQNEHAVFLSNFEDSSIERYEVTADFGIQQTGTLSFANYGIPYLNGHSLFFSDTRAYYLALEQGLIIVWNPADMTIVEDIDVSSLRREGFSAYAGTPHRDGDRYIAPILYVNEDWTGTEPDSTIGLVVEDGAPSPVTVLRDERAPGAFMGFASDNGDFYALADGLGGSLALTGQQDVEPPTLLRVRKGEDKIDEDYALDLGALIGTPGLQGLWPVSDTSFVVQAWASDVDPDSVLESPDDVWSAPYFDWKLVDAESEEVRTIEGIERAAPYSLARFSVDGRSFLQRYLPTNDDSGRAELYEVKTDATATAVAETSGEFWFLGRVEAPNR
jgi:hypothetical protein